MKIDDIGERQIKAPVRALMVGKEDNVALLLSNVKAGEAVRLLGGQIEIAAEDMVAGYKIAIKPLAPGQPVINYGRVIGTAIRAIRPGEWIHFHNLNSGAA
ncbi:MAG TPA: UxaA family hydrolase [Chloroflexia bacterium]|nr:UxaA family hydrolase [Chloroflexia bacterium]